MSRHRTMKKSIEDPKMHRVIIESDQVIKETDPLRRSFTEVTEGVTLEITADRQLLKQVLSSNGDEHYGRVPRSIARALNNDDALDLINPSREIVTSFMASVLNPISRSSGLTCTSNHKLSIPENLVVEGLNEIVVDLSINDKSGSPVCIGHTEEPGLLDAFIDRITNTLTPEFFMQDSVKELIWNMLGVQVRFGVKTNGQLLVLLELLEQGSYGLRVEGQGNQRWSVSTLSVGIAYHVLKVQNGSSLADFKRFVERADDAKKSNEEPGIFGDSARLISEANTLAEASN